MFSFDTTESLKTDCEKMEDSQGGKGFTVNEDLAA